VPLGGYLNALLTNAVRTHFSLHLSQLDQPDSITSHVAFLSRASFGPGIIRVEISKGGQQFSNARARLSQARNGKEMTCVEGMFVQGNLQRERESGGVSLAIPNPISPQEIWDRGKCPEIIDPPALFRMLSASTKLRRHMLPGTTYEGSWAHPIYGPSVRDEWLAWHERSGETVFDTQALPLLVDCSRPPAYEFDGVEQGRHWMATLSITMDIKKGPPSGSNGWKWLFLRAEMRNCNFGRYDTDLTLLDETGDVVAKGRRAELVLGAERRDKGAGKKGATQGPAEALSNHSKL
jgi:hypothetical protein